MSIKEKKIVIARKYDQQESLKSFFDKIILNNNNFLVLSSDKFKYIKNQKERIKNHRIDLILFKKKWFNAFVFFKKNKIKKFYFNFTKPPIIIDDCIEYIDLDIDLVMSGDFKNINILDQDEFEVNYKKYAYPNFFIEKSKDVIDEIKNIQHDKNFLKLIKSVI